MAKRHPFSESVKNLAREVFGHAVYDFLREHWPSVGGAILAVLSGASIFSVLMAAIPVSIPAVGFVSLIVGVGLYLFERVRLGRTIRKWSGIFSASPNESTDDRAKNRALLHEKIRGARLIEILGATGVNTFVRDHDAGLKLRTIIESTQAEIKILLLHPEAFQTKQRAAALERRVPEYQEEIRTSIEFLKELKRKGKTITLKFYAQLPIWKMIFAGDFLWLQHYPPMRDVEQAPVFGISQSLEGGVDTLFDPLHAVFGKKWDHDFNPTYIFDRDVVEYPDPDHTRVPLSTPPFCDLYNAKPGIILNRHP
ncbi:MAG: hypothetical protein HY207_00010 [Nitrospirae bacterium]|nr:hypothetical protein [Nitrospirota bacterium]